jgi:hypothetical protein
LADVRRQFLDVRRNMHAAVRLPSLPHGPFALIGNETSNRGSRPLDNDFFPLLSQLMPATTLIASGLVSSSIFASGRIFPFR